MMQNDIDLTQFTGPDVLVLSGRPKGEELRRKLGLDEADARQGPIMVTIPQNIKSLNSSFFLGLFAESVKRLGEKGFREKYRFGCRQIIQRDVDAGIEQALNSSNPLLPPAK